jgi:hypothetical protein
MTSGENTRAATQGDFSKLQGDLNFAFNQREFNIDRDRVAYGVLRHFQRYFTQLYLGGLILI